MEDYRKIAIELGQTLISKAPETREDVERMLPELKESEDERIREDIISHFAKGIEGSSFDEVREKYKIWISWLEKQGEHKNFRDSIQVGDKVTKNEDGVLVNLSQLKRVAKKDEQILANSAKTYKDKQKFAWSEKDEAMTEIIINDIVAIKERTCCKNVCNEEINWLESLKDRVQPKQEWNKEDERYLNIVSSVIGSPGVQGIYDYHKVNPTDVSGWLKSLKERVQPKQEWSEEDEKMLNDIIMCGEHHCYLDAGNIAWLKSIAPPYYCDNCKLKKSIQGWKPSDEQLNELRKVITNTGFNPYVIKSFYDDLKKLREG